eukprot:CAMPEP_0170147164 /NCGR_PEP_ID=MMETSP0033_2-20121228/33390_1 /TAXON_ID=195969 /ORGANISM="Dolichomastix tenuilepis, Strain CCMP3274" /LENGTH=119 /DNA_ID=CAMNT_0010383951 /DNA_START=49 /DNA_END=406 /DNA_ORIENTATION=-
MSLVLVSPTAEEVVYARGDVDVLDRVEHSVRAWRSDSRVWGSRFRHSVSAERPPRVEEPGSVAERRRRGRRQLLLVVVVVVRVLAGESDGAAVHREVLTRAQRRCGEGDGGREERTRRV